MAGGCYCCCGDGRGKQEVATAAIAVVVMADGRRLLLPLLHTALTDRDSSPAMALASFSTSVSLDTMRWKEEKEEGRSPGQQEGGGSEEEEEGRTLGQHEGCVEAEEGEKPRLAQQGTKQKLLSGVVWCGAGVVWWGREGSGVVLCCVVCGVEWSGVV